MNAAGFWDSKTAAQKVIDEYKVLKAQTSDLEEVITDFEDTLVGYELAKEAGDNELLDEVDEQLYKMQKRMRQGRNSVAFKRQTRPPKLFCIDSIPRRWH